MRPPLLPIGLLVILAACGSSTGPGSSLASLGRHFDSLAATACPAPFSGTPQPSCPFITAAAFGIQEGLLPSQVQVTTNSGGGKWLGYAFLMQQPRGGTIDTTYNLVAYDGVNVANAVLVAIPLRRDFAQLLVGSTVWSIPTDSIAGPASASVTSVGAPCSPTPLRAAGSPPFPPQHCRTATFQASFVITFLTAQSQTINLFAPSINGFVVDTTALQYARSFGKVR